MINPIKDNELIEKLNNNDSKGVLVLVLEKNYSNIYAIWNQLLEEEIRKGHFETFKVLVENAPVGSHALKRTIRTAILSAKEQFVDYILEKEGFLNADTIMDASEGGNLNIFKKIYNTYSVHGTNTDAAMAIAIENRNWDIVGFLKDKGFLYRNLCAIDKAEIFDYEFALRYLIENFNEDDNISDEDAKKIKRIVDVKHLPVLKKAILSNRSPDQKYMKDSEPDIL